MKTGKISFRLQTCQDETLIYSYTLILVYLLDHGNLANLTLQLT